MVCMHVLRRRWSASAACRQRSLLSRTGDVCQRSLREDARVRKSFEPELCRHDCWSVSQHRPVPHVMGHCLPVASLHTQRHALRPSGCACRAAFCLSELQGSCCRLQDACMGIPGQLGAAHAPLPWCRCYVACYYFHRQHSTRRECRCRHQTSTGSAPAVCWRVNPVAVGCNSAACRVLRIGGAC